MNDEELFNLFQNKKSDFVLCSQIEQLIKNRIKDAVGEQSAEYYVILTKLINITNNFGWEEKHSEQLDLIRQVMHIIVDKYEDYLP